MKIERGDIKICHQYPDRYKLCSSHTCVQVDKPCPCEQNEYQCSDSLCIPESQVCDGRNDCVNGKDELNCNYSAITEGTGSEELSVSIVIGISALSIGLCVLSVILVLIYVKRKYRRTTSESVEEPLRGGRSSSDEDDNDNENNKAQTILNDTKPHQNTTNNRNNIHGYSLVSNMDTIGDFGQGMLCASTPKQGVRQIQQGLNRAYSGNVSKPMSSHNTNLPDLLMNLSSFGNNRRKVAVPSSRNNRRVAAVNETELQNIPYIDSSQEYIDIHR